MKNNILQLAATFLVLLPLNASAMPVTVGMNDWMQPLTTVNNSWNDINTVCDDITGACAGTLGSVDLTGWTWASAEEVGDLLFAPLMPGFRGGIAYFDEIESGWAPAFLQVIAPTYNAKSMISTTAWTRTTWQDPAKAHVAWVSARPAIFGAPTGWGGTTQRLVKHTSAGARGGWFYRATEDEPTAEVPEPTTLVLLGIGLVGIGFGRRRYCKLTSG